MRRFQDWLIPKPGCVGKDLSASHVSLLASTVSLIPLSCKMMTLCNLGVLSCYIHGQKEFFLHLRSKNPSSPSDGATLGQVPAPRPIMWPG